MFRRFGKTLFMQTSYARGVYEFVKFRLVTKLQLTEPGPVYGSSTSGELARKLLTTLPWKFKSLQSVPIIVDSEKPADLIEFEFLRDYLLFSSLRLLTLIHLIFIFLQIIGKHSRDRWLCDEHGILLVSGHVSPSAPLSPQGSRRTSLGRVDQLVNWRNYVASR